VVYVNRVKTVQGKIIKLLHQAKALRVTDDGNLYKRGIDIMNDSNNNQYSVIWSRST
jgi:hypothetical protein